MTLFFLGVIACFIVALVAALGTMTITVVQRDRSWQIEAVAVGAAEYYQDGNVTKWRWRTDAKGE